MEDFGKLDVDINIDVKGDKKEIKKAEKKKFLESAIQEYQRVVSENPEIKQIAGTLAGKLEVVKALTYTDQGGLKLAGVEGNTRKLVPKSEIVGYIVKNLSDQPVQYTTMDWVLDPATGRWEGEKVRRVLQPGESVALSKKYFTLLASDPAILFKFSNGDCRIRFSEDPQKVLTSGYFVRSDDKSVNDEDFSERIDIKRKDKDGKDVYIIKKEYERVFGFLNNKPEKEVVARKSDIDKALVIAMKLRQEAMRRNEI